MSGLSRSLVRGVLARTVSEADRAGAERFVRDWLGSFVAGQATPPGRILLAYGHGSRDLERRVFLAAALSHVTETDDLHRGSVTHPGCVVVPTAWLLARRLGAGGRALLDAVLAGYEVMTRVGEALGPGHYRIFHNTATAGVFGSAAAAARLLDLDEDAWVWALGNAGTQAAGLWQFNEDATMSKHLHAGHAAAAGLGAALLAAEGFTGAEAILEGEKGLFRALCPDPAPARVLAEAPGWKLHETSIKPYPCCRHTHPAIDAALEARAALGDARPFRVEVTSYPAALDVTDRPRPDTTYAAKFSMQYCVATALLHGRPGLGSFEPERIAGDDVRGLLGRVRVCADESLARAYPERWGAAVEVEAEDGRTVRVERANASGDPDEPLADEELDEKVEGLCRWAGLGERRARRLLGRTRRLLDDGPPFRLPLVEKMGAGRGRRS